MGNGSQPRSWGRIIKRLTHRDDWSVARLAREADLNPSTLWEYIKTSDGKRVTVGTLLRIAAATGEDPITIFRAAAEIDDIEQGDPEIAAVRALNMHPTITAEVIKTIMDRRARDQERRMQDTDNMIRLVEGQTAS